MTENLPLVMTIACVRTRMRPDEVLRAATLTGARAVGRQDTVGSLAVGKRADCVIWAAPTYQHLVYHFGVDHVATVVKDGAIVSAPDHSGCLPH
jgi:imidazolonepropionase